MSNQIFFLFNNAFPHGYAASNRLLSLAKGLSELGDEVVVVCVRPSEKKNNIINKFHKGSYEGINYIYPAKTTIWPASKIMKLLVYTFGTASSFLYILREKPKILVSYTYSLIENLVFSFAAYVIKAKYVFIPDEFPYSVLYADKYNHIYRFIELNVLTKRYDVIMPMTFSLYDFYHGLKNRNSVIHLLPMTVELDRFKCINLDSPINGRYIAYTGFLGENKDGVDILIKAFSMVCQKFNDIKLVIIGYSDKKTDHELLETLTEKLGIQKNVLFTGKVDREQIPKFLCSSYALILARPNNIQAKGGFPTKLGEYLATGRPTIVTEVGDIPFYLKNEISAFIVQPDNIQDLAEKINYVLTNESHANRVGIEGQRVACEHFSNKIQSQKFKEIINQK